MATQTPSRFGAARGAAALLVFFLAAFVFVATAGAASPTSSRRGPMTPAPAAVPADTPVIPPAASAPAPAAAAPAASSAKLGLCQCISDRQALDFTCPGSAQACQSSCGQHFAFSPQVECRLDKH